MDLTTTICTVIMAAVLIPLLTILIYPAWGKEGAVIRGATAHFYYVAGEGAKAIAQAMLPPGGAGGRRDSDYGYH